MNNTLEINSNIVNTNKKIRDLEDRIVEIPQLQQQYEKDIIF